MSLEIVWEAQGVWRRFSGKLSTQDIRDAITIVHADERFADMRYSINDFLAVTSLEVTKASLAQAALKTIGDSKLNTQVMVAIVTNQAEIGTLAGFYTSPTYLPYPARTFETLAEARQWIAGP